MEFPEKNLAEQRENQQQNQPTYGIDTGFQPSTGAYVASNFAGVQGFLRWYCCERY